MPFFSRIGSALLVVLGVCTLVFLLIHLVPGDPVEAMRGESAQPADRAALRQSLGLDRPLAEQTVGWGEERTPTTTARVTKRNNWLLEWAR